jgi:hypothetical protein
VLKFKVRPLINTVPCVELTPCHGVDSTQGTVLNLLFFGVGKTCGVYDITTITLYGCNFLGV